MYNNPTLALRTSINCARANVLTITLGVLEISRYDDLFSMKMNTGAHGEALAVAYLEQKNYHIVERNWHCRRGEIDIVAQDSNVWVFCEVKTRRAHSTGQALLSITQAKQQKMMIAAQTYLAENGLDDAIWRIDAIGIALPLNSAPVIDHVEDVLDW